jgi:nitrogen regulatory protein PII
MQMIEAIVRPSAVEEITRQLTAAGILGCTAAECKGFGRQKGHTERYRGGRLDAGLLPKVLLKLAVRDDDADRALGVIKAAAKTGAVGDGKLFVYPLDRAIRIRTGEQNDTAL